MWVWGENIETYNSNKLNRLKNDSSHLLSLDKSWFRKKTRDTEFYLKANNKL